MEGGKGWNGVEVVVGGGRRWRVGVCGNKGDGRCSGEGWEGRDEGIA